MPSAHAKLGPSSAERWMNCPGSIRLSDQCPAPGSSEFAEEGTRAHAVAEAKLRLFNKEIKPAKAELLINEQEPDGEMEEATDFYRDRVVEIFNGAGEDAELMIEQQFSLEDYVPESFGTSDAVVIGDKTIEVIDLKYGKGVKVSAINNPQLRLYGLGAADLFEELYDFDTVRMTIIQPRLDHISTEEMPLAELRKWALEEVAPQAQKAMDGTGEVSPGTWCKWCPAKAICRKRAEANLELAKMEFREPELLTPEEIGEVLAKADQLKAWAKEIEDYALQHALDGEHFEGWKLVEGTSRRQITDKVKAGELLKAAGFTDEQIFKTELCGITDLEKACGKKMLADTLKDLIMKPAGKPVLVPESDKREAINSKAAAVADFK